MAHREADLILFEVLLTAFLLFAGLLLFYQVVTLNPVNPSSVIIIVSCMVLGFPSGLTAALLVTQGELKVLSKKGEFTVSNKAIIIGGVALILTTIFLNSLMTIFWTRSFIIGEIFFLFVGLFTFFLSRLIQIKYWENKNKRFIMMQFGTFTISSKLYLEPQIIAR
jgi:hypothetical protein